MLFYNTDDSFEQLLTRALAWKQCWKTASGPQINHIQATGLPSRTTNTKMHFKDSWSVVMTCKYLLSAAIKTLTGKKGPTCKLGPKINALIFFVNIEHRSVLPTLRINFFSTWQQQLAANLLAASSLSFSFPDGPVRRLWLKGFQAAQKSLWSMETQTWSQSACFQLCFQVWFFLI